MPGIVVFGRRWSVGSDDLVVAAVLLLVLHVAWIITLAVILGVEKFDLSEICVKELEQQVVVYISLLAGCLLVEGIVACISMRGNILQTDPRASIQYLLYLRLVILLGEVGWMVRCIVWFVPHFNECGPDSARKVILGVIVTSCLVVLIVVISVWCTFDTAGRKWVKMKRYQESLREKKRPGKRSGSTRRNWRQRKAFRAYEESWDRRLNILCCCIQRKGRNRNSIADVARLFTEFFRDLDVVPSDVIAGLVLLRRHQKLRMKYTVRQGSNDVYEYLSGVPVTPRSQFLSLRQPHVMDMYKLVLHYMSFALAAYGWPAFLMANTGTGLCRIIPHLRCCCCLSLCGRKTPKHSVLIDDNCCQCNFAALNKISGLIEKDIVYATYHVDVGETPFFVSLDHKNRNVVLSIRGTLSLQDIITDLKAEPEHIPIHPIKEEWYGHQGMVQAAVYIRKKIQQENILPEAFARDPSQGTPDYGLVLVGHSLGAGTAAILAILLKQEYPKIHCYAFSPPGGLLSPCCVEETKHFITSVVVGKDVVPRIGLHQMEFLRTDLINVIKQSTDPKWKIIGAKLLCCKGDDPVQTMDLYEMKLAMEKMDRDVRDVRAHPVDSAIGLSAHKPLFPPGKIIHVVRSHPKSKRRLCGDEEPVYQAVWADNADFEEVLISPTMINDHMPDNVLEALQKVLINVGPAKPSRVLTEEERKAMLEQPSPLSSVLSDSQHKLFLETSFNNSNHDSAEFQSIDLDSPIETNPNNRTILPQSNRCIDDPNYNNNDIPDQFLRQEHLPLQKAKPKTGPEMVLELCRSWSQNPRNGDEDSGNELENDDDEPAPLASPEALSESSSILSLVSRSCSLRDSQYRLANEFPKMEKIVQSPEEPVRQVCVRVRNPNRNTTSDKRRALRFSDDETVLTEATVENCREPKISESPPSPRVKTDRTSPVKETSFLETSLIDNNVSETSCSQPSKAQYRLSLVDESKKVEQTLSPDAVRVSGYYQRHSPIECSQHEYAQYKGYYSPAGRGYPHGAYHPPYRQVSPGGLSEGVTIDTPKTPDSLGANSSSPPIDTPPEASHSAEFMPASTETFQFPLPLQQTDV